MILDLSVTVESIIQEGFAQLIANATTQVPLILAQFPEEYQTAAVEYLTDPNFKVTSIFQFYYDPAVLPAWNIVLSNENEVAGNQQMFLNDLVDGANMNPNTEDFEQYGSDWSTNVDIFIRAQKDRQCIILYALTKWVFLQNRLTLEAAGFKANVFSGSDINYEVKDKPTFVFTRRLRITCRALQTVDVNITGDPIIQNIQSAFPTEVTVFGELDIPQSVPQFITDSEDDFVDTNEDNPVMT
jgi:hypothetical protein